MQGRHHSFGVYHIAEHDRRHLGIHLPQYPARLFPGDTPQIEFTQHDIELAVDTQGELGSVDVSDHGGVVAGRADELRKRFGTGRNIVYNKHITFSGHQRGL